MYKLIAVDLDGTLLNSYGEVTENTKQVINTIQNQGIEFIIASGRPMDSIKTIAKTINSNKYFIAGNGAIIYDIQNQETIYENCLPKNKVLQISEICQENNITYNIYTEQEVIAESLKYNVLYYYKENLKKAENEKTKIILVDNLYEYIQTVQDLKCIKITVCDSSKSVFNSIIKKLQTIQNIDIMDVSHMSRKMIRQGTEDVPIEYFYTEISSTDVDKWEALQYLAQVIQVEQKEIIAIGDNINDKKMIQNAGIGICMGQSAPTIKEVADYVTEDNNSEGVAKAILEFCGK